LGGVRKAFEARETEKSRHLFESFAGLRC